MAVPYTAQFFDHLMVTERQRAATEGAVRASISKLINDLFVFNVGVAQNPPKVARPAITKSNEEKLRELKRLNDAGLISKEVYVDQQKIILNMP